MTRRPVRVSDDFYADLDAQLGAERGSKGEPSAADFLRFDLLPLIDTIAESFDELLEAIDGHPQYRVLVTAGILVPRMAITSMLTADGSIELIQLDLDLDAPWD